MIKYKKMNFIDELKEYLRSKTKEEVLNDWEESRIESGVQFAEQVINKSESIPVVSDMLCGTFDADNSTSSATKCKCGRDKWEHPKPRN
jgi:hypothetical protein